MSIQELVEISRFYGKNPDYVLAGGGNTSWKDGETLFIKASGSSLAEADADSFVKMDRKALALIWEKIYPEASAERESSVLADMMAARKPGEEQKRPSVETLLHDMLPFAFVAHLHPALVNGLTCSQQGETAMKEIFGNEALWIPSTNPGYVLSRVVKTAMDGFINGKAPAIIFLQNHGVFVGSDSSVGIKSQYSSIMLKLNEKIIKQPAGVDTLNKEPVDTKLLSEITRTLAELAEVSVFMPANYVSGVVKDRAAFAPVSSAFTPDHIVYAGSDPLFCETDTADGIREAWKDHLVKKGMAPKIVAVQGIGVFGVGSTEKAASLALLLFRDAVRVAVYSESFGGPLFMTQDKIDFINNWEVERFRTIVSTK